MSRTMTKRFRFRFQKSERAFPFAHLSDYAVYKITNARKRYRAPFPWGICLRSTSTAPKSKTTAERGETGLKVIAFHSEKSRACWLTAMRLAKVIERSFTVFPILPSPFSFLVRPIRPPLLLLRPVASRGNPFASSHACHHRESLVVRRRVNVRFHRPRLPLADAQVFPFADNFEENARVAAVFLRHGDERAAHRNKSGWH